MTPRSLLLCGLVFLSFFSNVSSPLCNNQRCRFVEGFPVRLRKLRENYKNIRDYYTPFACHTMNSILEFYLETVLPTALSGVTEDIRDLKPHMESIQHICDQLKADLTKCRHYFSCKKQFNITNLNSTYAQDSQICCFLLLRSYIENIIAATLLQRSGQHSRQRQEGNIWDTSRKAPDTQGPKKLYRVIAERGRWGNERDTTINV